MSRMFLFLLVAACIATTLSHAQYCTSGPTSPQDSNLGAVSLVGISKSIDNTNNCPGQVGVQDFTKDKADVALGMEYTVHFDVTTCGSEYSRRSAVWIDWNNDQMFEANEQIVFTDGVDEQHKKFTVPLNATVGTTVMRVMVQETNVNSINPCSADFSYGGTKDFSIVIIGHAQNCNHTTVPVYNPSYESTIVANIATWGTKNGTSIQNSVMKYYYDYVNGQSLGIVQYYDPELQDINYVYILQNYEKKKQWAYIPMYKYCQATAIDANNSNSFKWMAKSSYVSTIAVNNNITDLWEVGEHTQEGFSIQAYNYCSPYGVNVPTRMNILSPSDDIISIIDYLDYRSGNPDSKVFSLPAYCQSNRQRSVMLTEINTETKSALQLAKAFTAQLKSVGGVF